MIHMRTVIIFFYNCALLCVYQKLFFLYLVNNVMVSHCYVDRTERGALQPPHGVPHAHTGVIQSLLLIKANIWESFMFNDIITNIAR